jgi:diadenosine tetraphosphate (Ap4A) HIT family hydrolase
MAKSKLMDLDNARTAEQLELMRRIEEDGVCPFCREHLELYHPKPLIRENGSWVATENISPYSNTRLHLLVVYTRGHIEEPSDLDDQACVEYFEMVSWATREYEIPGGGVLLRFGATEYSAGSVHHLHFHIIVPDYGAEGYQPVRAKIGSHMKED